MPSKVLVLDATTGLPKQSAALFMEAGDDPTTSAGDLTVRGSSGLVRLPIGSEGQVLTVVSGAPHWAGASSVPGVVTPGIIKANQTLYPVTDGVATSFTIPTIAISGTISVYERLNGETSYRLVGPDRISVSSTAPRVENAASISVTPALIAGYGSSGTTVAFVDHNPATGSGWNNYGASIDTPIWVLFDFGTTPKEITSGIITGMTSGGWSPPNHVNWQYSDDNSTWTTAHSDIGPTNEGETTTHTWTSVGSHRYWRLYILDNHVNGGGYMTAMREVGLLTPAPSFLNTVIFTSAPASTTALLVSYQEPG